MRRTMMKRWRERDKAQTDEENTHRKERDGNKDKEKGEAVKDSGGLEGRTSTLMDYSAFRLLLEAFGNPCTLCLILW